MCLKWRAACEAIIFTCTSKFGHHSLEKNWRTREIENTVSYGTSFYCCWPCPSKDISRMCPVLSYMCPVLSCVFPVLSVGVVNLLRHSFLHRNIVYCPVCVLHSKLLAILNLATWRQIHQINKLKASQKFPAIRYIWSEVVWFGKTPVHFTVVRVRSRCPLLASFPGLHTQPCSLSV